jgi:restriction endonuclease Mrr
MNAMEWPDLATNSDTVQSTSETLHAKVDSLSISEPATTTTTTTARGTSNKEVAHRFISNALGVRRNDNIGNNSNEKSKTVADIANTSSDHAKNQRANKHSHKNTEKEQRKAPDASTPSSGFSLADFSPRLFQSALSATNVQPWKCQACTYENTADKLCCEMCTATKPMNSKGSKQKHTNSR